MNSSPKPGDLCRVELNPNRNPYLGGYDGSAYLAHRFLQGRFDPQVFERFNLVGICIPPHFVGYAYNEYHNLVYPNEPQRSPIVLFQNEIWLFEPRELRIL